MDLLQLIFKFSFFTHTHTHTQFFIIHRKYTAMRHVRKKHSKRDINYSIIRLEGQSETIKRPAVGSGRILEAVIIGARTCRHDE